MADKEEFFHLHFQRDWFLNLISYWHLFPIGLDESLFVALGMPDTNNSMLMPKKTLMHWGETWVCFSIFFTKLTFDNMGTILMYVVPKWDLWIIT